MQFYITRIGVCTTFQCADWTNGLHVLYRRNLMTLKPESALPCKVLFESERFLTRATAVELMLLVTLAVQRVQYIRRQ